MEFSWSSKRDNTDRQPIVDGILPEIEFCDIVKLVSVLMIPSADGSVPLIPTPLSDMPVFFPIAQVTPSQVHASELGDPPVQLQPLTVSRAHKFVAVHRSHIASSCGSR